MKLCPSCCGVLFILGVLCCVLTKHGYTSGFTPSITPARSLRSHRLWGQAPPSSAGTQVVKVALTRKSNQNHELKESLSKLQCFEIPCISFETFPERKEAVAEGVTSHDVVAITSPQSAKVFLSVWKSIGEPHVKVACVGKGTSEPLVAAGLQPVFEPSDATAVSFGQELPHEVGETVFYPASALADNRLQELLVSRGFKVTRVNAYTTNAVPLTPEQIELGRQMDIVMFASPSAVKCWATQVGTAAHAVAIGTTTADAARKAGFERVCSPSVGSKGVGPWAELALEVASGLQR